MAKKLTSDKAKEILHDKSVHGHPLTDKQRRFFGAIAGGAPMKAQDGKDILSESTIPMPEYKPHSINPYAYSFSPVPNVNVYGLGMEAEHNIGKRLNLHGGFNTESAFFPGGSKTFMKPKYNAGISYKFKQGGWLDKYADGGTMQEHQENYNDNTTSYPPGFIGMGNDTTGRNYSPAWGGQFQMGGSLPGAVGFTYARTAGAAPSNGPYAKKTKASAENGMTYYQHGLDWKPKSISRDGSIIPQAQTGKTFEELTGLKPIKSLTNSGESTSLGTKLDEAAIRQASIDTQRKKQGQIRKAEPDRSAASKAWAIATHPMTALSYKVKGQDIPEHFERGESNPLEYATDVINPFTYAQSATNVGEGLQTMIAHPQTIGDQFLPTLMNAAAVLPILHEIPGAGKIAQEAGSMMIDLPRASSIKEAIRRVGGIPLEKDLSRLGAQDVKALRQVQEIGRLRATNSPMSEQMRYGLENNLPEEHFQKVFGRSREEAQNLLDTGFGEKSSVPPGSSRPNPELARLRAQGSPELQSPREMLVEHLRNNEHVIHGAEPEVRTIAGDANIGREDGIVNYDALSDEQLVRLRDFAEDQNYILERLGPETDLSNTELTRGQRSLMDELFGGTEGLTQDELRDRIRALEQEDDVFDPPEYTPIDPEPPINSGNRINLRTASPEEIRDFAQRAGMTEDELRSMDRSERVRNVVDRFSQPSPEQMETYRNQIDVDLERLRRTGTSMVNKFNKKLENFIGNKIQNYPYYSERVVEKVPMLSLSGSGGLKDVSKTVNFAPEGIKSGDVFTGSTNTSHSSYLPQLKQVFKYTKGDPQFLGYKPMNSMGFLSQYGYEGEDIAKYLNSEIDEQIKRGVIPKDVLRPFQKEERVMLPHYGVKQHRKGGVIEDDRGQWAHPGKITKINSNQITMKGVDYPVLGVSDEGHTQMMYPDQEYTFKGKTVTEYPQKKKNGGWLEKYN